MNEETPRPHRRVMTAADEIYGKYLNRNATVFDETERTEASDVRYDATCSSCEKPTTVSFKPDPSRPVYCLLCWRERKSVKTQHLSEMRLRTISGGTSTCEECGEEAFVSWWFVCRHPRFQQGNRRPITVRQRYEPGKTPGPRDCRVCNATISEGWRSPDFRQPVRCDKCRRANKNSEDAEHGAAATYWGMQPTLRVSHRQALDSFLARVGRGHIYPAQAARALADAGVELSAVAAMRLSRHAQKGLEAIREAVTVSLRD